MIRKRVQAAVAGMAIAMVAPAAQAQYTTDWLANTFGTLAAHVGNAARAMWVAPEGVIYTASRWDENAGGMAIYQNGQPLGSIGIHDEFHGGAITGNATSVFAALGYNRTFGSGSVGRYNRGTHKRDLRIPVSVWTSVPYADVITGLATAGSLLYASDFYGNRVRVFTTDGVWQRDIAISRPGALALDGAGNLWVAQKSAGAVVSFGPSGALLNTIQMPPGSRPSALYFDAPSGQLMVGDEGPDMNIKRYAISGMPALAGTFGIRGGYLDTTTGIKGQVGDKRFTRVAGIGKDAAGNLYVLNNAWGGGWDLGRNGSTDLHAYDGNGNLRWKLQALNFEGAAAPDPATDGAYFYSGNNLYTGTAGGRFVANTVDPFAYPSDPRLNMKDYQRGQHFGQLVAVGGNRILVASGQNPGDFNFYHFNAANGYVAIPDGSIPGRAFRTNLQVTAGFCLDGNGDVWAGLNGTRHIDHYPLTGFDAAGKPSWGASTAIPIPQSVLPLTRIVYQSDSDTMILAQGQSVRTLREMTEEIVSLAGENRELARSRFRERIEALSGEAGVDPVRVQQEAAILIDRLDISEECERLRSHLAGMEGMLRNEGNAVGKRFDFLVQEAFREMNTASSKSAHAGISERVVAAKTELEKIREQIQNVE